MKSKNKIAYKSYNVKTLFEEDENPYNHAFISSGSVSIIRPDDIKTFFIDFNVKADMQIIE